MGEAARAEAAVACFHCGLDVPPGGRWRGDLLGERRDFCCGGCLAVAEAIAAGGLADYYRLRTALAATAAGNAATAAEDAATAAGNPARDDRYFDRGDLQETFVRRVGSHREVSLFIEGVRCPACLWLNERRLQAVPGVVEAVVPYAGETARVRWDPSRVSLGAILAAVRAIGYEARPIDARHREGLSEEAARRGAGRLVFAGAVGMMVMNLALAAYFLGGPDGAGRLPLWETFGRWASLAASALLLAYPGREFFAGARRDLRSRRAGMDVPIAIGLLAAWIGGAAATIAGTGPVYFDAIAMLVFFVLLARAFETRARLAAAAALDRFAVIRPARARRVDSGREVETAALDLAAGDAIRVFPGEVVAADAVVLEGTSSFDESIVTGEPAPRPRARGEALLAGSVNLDQPVLARVTRAGSDSTLGEVHRLLERGLASRPPSARMADRLAAGLVAAVLVIAAGTAAFWAFRDPARSLAAAVAVLIVTCPCALALATPLALAITAGRLLREGVLPARMAAIEGLAEADTAVFDKTGTLTRSALALESVSLVGGLTRAGALETAAALETGSPHPVARALRDAAGGERGVPARDVEYRPGAGIEGTVGESRWRLGSPEFALPGGPGSFDAGIAAERARGRVVACLTDGGGRAALFALAEELRPGAETLVAGLRRAGVRRTVLLSGDAAEPVGRIARMLGFDEWRAGMRPEDKLSWAGGRGHSERLLFVGDGLNDAPALAACGTSVSFEEAPALSRLTSDFVILGGGLDPLAAARRLARRCRRVLAQNVGWALAYNALFVPLAAAGRLPPWEAALGMSASSVVVVLNSMRLARGKPAPGRGARASGAREPAGSGRIRPTRAR